MGERAFDVVVFGATGFTGSLVVEYLARHGARGARWAIAGRSTSKLASLRERARALGAPAPEMLQADVADPASLRRMAAATKVVLTTVGPYSEYGEGVVAACVAEGASYVDITGEPAFVADLLKKYDAAARDAKVRIVPCCGFDSIPHDLGAQHCVEQLPSDEALVVRAYVRANGSVSGGTWHSAIGGFSKMAETAGALGTIVRVPGDGKRVVSGLPMSLHREAIVDAWGVPLPTIDPAIVLRSAGVLPEYGTGFRYGHFAKVKHFSTVASASAGLGALVALARIPAARKRLLELRKPGEGPTEEQRRRGFFEVDFLGESASGKRVRTRVSGGEPGYSETSKMISESALCLALDDAKLAPRYGVLTTAIAMGKTLRERLVGSGIRFEIVA